MTSHDDPGARPRDDRPPAHLLDRLLRDPEGVGAQLDLDPAAIPLLPLAGAALLSLAVTGFVAGSFQGGAAYLWAALKVPTVVFGSVLLCLPSLYVLCALGGGRLRPEALLKAAAGFGALWGILLMALAPVVWLFSVSSRSLVFLTLLHTMLAFASLCLAARGLRHLLANATGIVRLAPWVMLVWLVTLQMTTHLRPILWRDAESAAGPRKKLFFLEHLMEVGRWDEKRAN
jgi:hypothetical protein